MAEKIAEIFRGSLACHLLTVATVVALAAYPFLAGKSGS